MKKIISFVLVLTTFIGIMVTPAFNLHTINACAETSKEVTASNSGSKNGWYVSNGKKIYYVNGAKVSGKTKKIDGKIYLFDSNGYLQTDGIHEVNGKKYYSDKDGVVKCNQWVSHKYAKSGNTYYYATSTGKIIEYRFKKQSNSDIYLYVNGKKSKADDIPLNGTFKLSDYIDTSEYDDFMKNSLSQERESRIGYFKVGSHYYHLDYDSTKECVVCDKVDKIVNETYNTSSNTFYDLGSGKKLGHILGLAKFDSKGYITTGAIVNTQEHYFYMIIDDDVKKTKILSPIIITDYSTKLNTVGGLDYTLTVANNSGKTINYIHYTVHVINRVGDAIYDTISDKKTFHLKDTGPYAANETSSGIWEAMMYNYSAYDVVIDKVEIEYKDGSTDVVNGSDITMIKVG